MSGHTGGRRIAGGLPERLQPWRERVSQRRQPLPPRVTVGTGPTVPAWAPRLVVLAAGLGVVALLAAHRVTWLLGMVLLASTAIRPHGGGPPLLAAGAGLVLLTSAQEPFHPRLYVLVFALHLMIALGALVGPLAWQTSVEWRALARAGLGFGVVQVIAQGLALLGAFATQAPQPVTWLPVVGAAALAALTWALAANLRSAR